MPGKPAASGPKSNAAQRHVAVLRGINLGGKNKLAMQSVVRIFAAAGCSEVRTYIQSGNIVFNAPARVVQTLAKKISAHIASDFGLDVPVVLRSADELSAAIEANPFIAQGKDADHLHLALLAGVPSPAKLSALDPARSPGDEFVLHGRDLYLYLPNGVAKTKLTNAYLDAKLGTVSTFRNWRTVLKLLELCSA
jgi:uncharacterized protein (DUF1697 family)